MAKTVVLTDLQIKQISINYEQQCVRVIYRLVDDTGTSWQEGDAYFWVTIPPSDPVPENWFQLPADYIPTFVQLRDDADTALTNKFLV